MYNVPKFETGLNKGRDIMYVCETNKRWSDSSNNIFVDREHDEDWNDLDTFRVAERLRGNTHTIWATGRTFDEAIDLACRLVVGDNYLPPRRPKPIVVVPTFEFEVGDVIPGDLYMHQINDRAFGELFAYDDDSRMEFSAAHFSALVFKNPGNKHARIISMDEENTIPEKMMIAYMYDDRYFTAILRRKN